MSYFHSIRLTDRDAKFRIYSSNLASKPVSVKVTSDSREVLKPLHSSNIRSESVEDTAIKFLLTVLNQDPADYPSLKQSNSDIFEEKFYEDISKIETYSRSREKAVALAAKNRAFRLLEQNLSFLDKANIYDSLKDNTEFSAKERKEVTKKIFSELSFNDAFKDNEFQHNLIVSFNQLSELAIDSNNQAEAADLIQKVLVNSQFSSTHLLSALKEVDKLMPFKKEDGSLSDAGKAWQKLIQDKFEDIIPSLQNEKALAVELNKLNLDQINAARLIQLLEKTETADDFYNIYTAVKISLNEPRDSDIVELNKSRIVSLDKILLGSAENIKWTNANPQECLEYIKLFEDRFFQNGTERKLKQLEIAARFYNEAGPQFISRSGADLERQQNHSQRLISNLMQQIMGLEES